MAFSEETKLAINALKVRLFSIKANLEFGNEYLKKISSDKSQLASLIQDQKDYERKVGDLVEDFEQFLISEHVDINSKQFKIKSSTFLSESSKLLKDSRNNSVLRKISEIRENHLINDENLSLEMKLDDYYIAAAGLAEKVDQENLNIVIIGERGAGKSSFINSFFEVESWDEKAVKTDAIECTLIPKIYTYNDFKEKTDSNSENPMSYWNKIKIWDYPGVGTDRFPIDEYKQVIKYLPVDAFIHLYDKRFSETDQDILEELIKEKRTFFLVRTKADLYFDVDKIKKDLENSFTFDDCGGIEKRLDEQWKQFKNQAKNDKSVHQFLKFNFEESNLKFYFISCKNEFRSEFDFSLLMEDLMVKLPKEKTCFLLSNLRIKSHKFFYGKLVICKLQIENWIFRCLVALEKNSEYKDGDDLYFRYLAFKILEIHSIFGVETEIFDLRTLEILTSLIPELENVNFNANLLNRLVLSFIETREEKNMKNKLFKKHKQLVEMLEKIFDLISMRCCQMALAHIDSSL